MDNPDKVLRVSDMQAAMATMAKSIYAIARAMEGSSVTIYYDVAKQLDDLSDRLKAHLDEDEFNDLKIVRQKGVVEVGCDKYDPDLLTDEEIKGIKDFGVM